MKHEEIKDIGLELIIRSNIKNYDGALLKQIADKRGGVYEKALTDIGSFEQEQKFRIDNTGWVRRLDHYSSDAFTDPYCDMGQFQLPFMDAASNSDYKGMVDTLITSASSICVGDAVIFGRFLKWAYGHKRGD